VLMSSGLGPCLGLEKLVLLTSHRSYRFLLAACFLNYSSSLHQQPRSQVHSRAQSSSSGRCLTITVSGNQDYHRSLITKTRRHYHYGGRARRDSLTNGRQWSANRSVDGGAEKGNGAGKGGGCLMFASRDRKRCRRQAGMRQSSNFLNLHTKLGNVYPRSTVANNKTQVVLVTVSAFK